jgi:lipoprotein-releasing system permease protein
VSFARFVALRYLREDRAQTLLILAAVSIGVTVIVFLSALIGGLQASLIERTLGSQPHVTVRPAERVPRGLARAGEGTQVATLVEKAPQPLLSIDQWQVALAEAERTPGVVAASPTVSGAAFAVRGNARRPVVVRGVDETRFARVIPLPARLRAGRYSLDGSQALIGSDLAAELGVAPGATITVEEPEGRRVRLTIGGVFELGSSAVDGSWVVTSLRQGQSLFGLPGGASTLELKLRDVFAAEDTARLLGARTGLDVESWMAQNAQLLSGLRAQESSKQMIQFFVVLAVTLGIASVMIVSVTQKAREIGILRAVGTPRRLVQRIFLLQGAVLGLTGSLLGGGLGALFAWLFEGLARNPDGSPQFPVRVTLALLAGATALAVGVGLAAAALPARRAARLDPATAIRNG